MRATQGALIVASTLQMILGFSGLWRNVVRLVWRKKMVSNIRFSYTALHFFSITLTMRRCKFLLYIISRFLSPISAVPLVGLVGFGLYEFGFPGVSLL